MKRLKTKLFSLLLVCLMFCLGMGMVTVNAKTNKDTGFELNVEAGLEGKVLDYTPFQVNITATSDKNFKGTIRITPLSGDGRVISSTSTDVTLAAGESKTINMTCSGMDGNYYKIELLNVKGKVVHTQKEKMEILAESKVLMGVLSNDMNAVSYMNNAYVGEEKRISLIALDAKMFPVESCNLESLSVILVDNYDMSNLTEEQINSLEQWVRKGGKLILSLGANYQTILYGGLERFGMETNGELIKQTLVSEADIEYQMKDVPCLAVSMADAKTMDVGVTNAQFTYKEYGEGTIAVLPYAVGMKPIAQNADAVTLCSQIIQTILETDHSLDKNFMKYNFSLDSLVDIADQSEDKPSALLYAVILLLYVALIGPGIYFILKKMKKSEKIWIAMPVIVVLFVGIIYITGRFYRIDKPIMNNVSLVFLSDESQLEYVCSNIICPKAKKYNVSINKEYEDTGFRQNMYGYYYGRVDSNKTIYDKKTNGDQVQLQIENSVAFEERNYMGLTTKENKAGKIECDLACTPYEFDGTVCNNTEYDLRNVVVFFENHFYIIDSLAKGETVSLDKNEIRQLQNYNTFYDIYYTNDNLEMDSDTYRAYEICETMESLITENFSDKLNTGLIWAEAVGFTSEVAGDSNTVNSHDIGIIMQQFEQDYQTNDGCEYSMLDDYLWNTEGDYELYGRELNCDDMLATYSLETLDNISALQNLTMYEQNNSGNDEDGEESMFRNEEEAYALVYAYNVKTDSYDLLFEDSDTLSKEELKAYIKDGKLQLKYVITENSEVYGTIPKIVVKEEK